MGLVSLTIAHELKILPNAEERTIKTLETMNGLTHGFNPAKNKINGFFRHFIDMKTGERAWNSEYSSIDTAILIAGALFSKTYFSNN